jgi:hypothetical protein
MANKKVYYQGCISQEWRDCYLWECTERDKCPQFQKWNSEEQKKYQEERVRNGEKL